MVLKTWKHCGAGRLLESVDVGPTAYSLAEHDTAKMNFFRSKISVLGRMPTTRGCERRLVRRQARFKNKPGELLNHHNAVGDALFWDWPGFTHLKVFDAAWRRHSAFVCVWLVFTCLFSGSSEVCSARMRLAALQRLRLASPADSKFGGSCAAPTAAHRRPMPWPLRRVGSENAACDQDPRPGDPPICAPLHCTTPSPSFAL